MKNIVELSEQETADVLCTYFARTRNVNPAVVRVRIEVGVISVGVGPGDSQRPGFQKAVIALPDTELKE